MAATHTSLDEVADSLQHIVGWDTASPGQGVLTDCINSLRRMGKQPPRPDALRDIFAGIAMHAIITNMVSLKEGVGVAEQSYKAADAMMVWRLQQDDEAAGQGA